MRDLFNVRDKVVLVTGGSRGIGAMIARGFVENGAKVYIASRDEAACDSVAAELSRIGDCTALPADLSSNAGVQALADAVSAREARLDVLINNAGATWAAPVEEFSESGWDKVMDLNVKSVFFLTQKLLPLLRAANAAANPSRVINIASVAGMNPPPRDSFAYSASKAGCIMLTRHLAKVLAREGILVNAISPGPFVSRMTESVLATLGAEVAASVPLGRIGEPEDVAGVAIFLGSRASAYLTGAVIPCDGGTSQA